MWLIRIRGSVYFSATFLLKRVSDRVVTRQVRMEELGFEIATKINVDTGFKLCIYACKASALTTLLWSSKF